MSVAMVTGGSAGLGRALTKALVKEGWSVVIDGSRVQTPHGGVGGQRSSPITRP